VHFNHPEREATPIDATARVFSSGVYDLELDASQAENVVPGLVADVFHVFASGHQQYARAVVELAQVSPGSPLVTGYVEPRSPVTARHFGAGCAHGEGRAISRDTGQFLVELADEHGEPVAAQPDCTVEVDHQRATHRIPVASLAGWAISRPGGNVDTDGWPDGALAGVTGEGLIVWSLLRFGAAPTRDEILGKTPPRAFHGKLRLDGGVDPAGVFVVGPVALSLPSVLDATLVAELPTGDQLRRMIDVGRGPDRILLPYAVNQ
jgi:hypothetical protein